MKFKRFVNEDGFTDEAPDTLINGSWIYEPLVPIWSSFLRLSRGRPYSGMGAPLPIPYRDIRDEVADCRWPDKAQTERWIVALDDEFLRLAEKRQSDAPGSG